MILDFEEYGIARNLVEEVISREFSSPEIKTKIDEAVLRIVSTKKREFVNHVNTLFLNVLLNRAEEVGEIGIKNSIEARRLISWMRS